MINVIIWSKDRAAQLDLTLSSMKKYFVDWKQQSYTIIYKHSNSLYEQGYNVIKRYHPEFNYVLEKDFHNDTVNAFMNTDRNLTSFLVDDDVFVDYFSTSDQEFKEFLNNPQIICLSPRLAPYIDYCYTQNASAPTPALNEKRIWNWIGQKGDWEYPASVASFHVFRKNDLEPLILKYPFKGPNTFEGLCLAPYMPRTKPLMICFNHAKCICSTNNKVQHENNNRHENSHPIDYLNYEFINGQRLDESINNGLKLRTCHGPVQLTWK